MKKIFSILFLCLLNCYSVISADSLKHQLLAVLKTETLAKANWALSQIPITVTASHTERSAGGVHDFFSEGDYWWQDPANPNGPYIQKDGMSNPNNFTDHRKAISRSVIKTL